MAIDILLSRNCSRDEFVLLFVKMLQEHVLEATIEMTGESQVRIVRPDAKEVTVFLDNAWISYSNSPESRREMLERHLRLAFVLDEQEPFAKERLVATIKDSVFMSQFNADGQMVCEHLCGDLWINYAEDLPDRVRSVKHETIQNAGLHMKDLLELAKENLRRILPQTERLGDGPWYLLSAGGDYSASLLLFDELWDDLADSVEGDIVAAVPARDVLMYTGSQSAAGIADIRHKAATIFRTGNYVISQTLIVRLDGRWQAFDRN